MEELERPAPQRRRRRRRSVQIIHRLKTFVPLVLICVAAMLSAGVVRVMEVSRVPAVEKTGTVVSEAKQLEPGTFAEALRVEESVDVPNLLVSPSAPPKIGEILSVSILDQQPESDASSELSPETGELLDGLTPFEPMIPELSPVPEPSTLLLVGGSLVWLATGGRLA